MWHAYPDSDTQETKTYPKRTHNQGLDQFSDVTNFCVHMALSERGNTPVPRGIEPWKHPERLAQWVGLAVQSHYNLEVMSFKKIG